MEYAQYLFLHLQRKIAKHPPYGRRGKVPGKRSVLGMQKYPQIRVFLGQSLGLCPGMAICISLNCEDHGECNVTVGDAIAVYLWSMRWLQLRCSATHAAEKCIDPNIIYGERDKSSRSRRCTYVGVLCYVFLAWGHIVMCTLSVTLNFSTWGLIDMGIISVYFCTLHNSWKIYHLADPTVNKD